jgi:hypothetical protein
VSLVITQLIAEHLFRPFDLVSASDRADIRDKVHDVNATIEGLFDFWTKHYGESWSFSGSKHSIDDA